MSKINLETFKKLFSVKSGGAEIFRLLVKFIFWLFIIGAIFSIIYSLNNIQKYSEIRTNIEIAKAQMEVAKIQRQCDFSAKNNLALALDAAKKAKKDIKKEDQTKIYQEGFSNCLYLNGFDLGQNKKEKTN